MHAHLSKPHGVGRGLSQCWNDASGRGAVLPDHPIVCFLVGGIGPDVDRQRLYHASCGPYGLIAQSCRVPSMPPIAKVVMSGDHAMLAG